MIQIDLNAFIKVELIFSGHLIIISYPKDLFDHIFWIQRNTAPHLNYIKAWIGIFSCHGVVVTKCI